MMMSTWQRCCGAQWHTSVCPATFRTRDSIPELTKCLRYLASAALRPHWATG